MWLKLYCTLFYFIEGGKPYYFGTTDLLCKLGRRSVRAPSRFSLGLSHGWILFDGEYFEWGGQRRLLPLRPHPNGC